MGIVTVSTNQQSQKFFTRMDKVFWVLWALVPITFGVVIYYMMQPAQYRLGLTPEQITCLGEKLSFGQGSRATGGAILIQLAYQFLFYVVAFAFLHRMIRQFVKGSIFVGRTLNSVQTLGWIIVGFPFGSALISTASDFILRKMGQPSVGDIPYLVDPAPIAFGLFLVALKHVLHHAMRMKFENDLTI